MTTFVTPEKKAFENIVRKREIAPEAFSFFPHNVFFPVRDKFNVLSNSCCL